MKKNALHMPFLFIASSFAMESPPSNSPSLPIKSEFKESYFSLIPLDILTIIVEYIEQASTLNEALSKTSTLQNIYHDDSKIIQAYAHALRKKFGLDDLNKTLITYSENGNAPHVNLLLLAGANTQYISPDNRTALGEAARKNNIKVLELLLQNGANINGTDNSGQTALHEAVQGNALQAAEYLIKQGANINAQDIDGDTPLISAVLDKNPKMVQLFLKHGAQISIKDNEGKNALNYARANNHTKIIFLLLKKR